MQEEQKQAILSLRSEGESYAEIADYLGMSPNTVKSFCRRRQANPPQTAAENSPDICRNCGTPLTQANGHRKKSFCSDRCRYIWWNHTRRGKPYWLTCKHCGRKFISLGSRNRKFCSRECRNSARYGEGLP